MKCQMDGRRILRMGKQLTTDAAAEVVGPARFGRAGAAVLSTRLSELAAGPDRRQWAYTVFGDLAIDLAFTGVDNAGYFWAEVDTVADKREAERRIPQPLVAFAARDAIASRAQSIRAQSPAADVFPTHES